MERPQVAGGEDDLQIVKIAGNKYNKQSRTAENGWLSSWGPGQKLIM
jgi:hypothetical protein